MPNLVRIKAADVCRAIERARAAFAEEAVSGAVVADGAAEVVKVKSSVHLRFDEVTGEGVRINKSGDGDGGGLVRAVDKAGGPMELESTLAVAAAVVSSAIPTRTTTSAAKKGLFKFSDKAAIKPISIAVSVAPAKSSVLVTESSDLWGSLSSRPQAPIISGIARAFLSADLEKSHDDNDELANQRQRLVEQIQKTLVLAAPVVPLLKLISKDGESALKRKRDVATDDGQEDKDGVATPVKNKEESDAHSPAPRPNLPPPPIARPVGGVAVVDVARKGTLNRARIPDFTEVSSDNTGSLSRQIPELSGPVFDFTRKTSGEEKAGNNKGKKAVFSPYGEADDSHIAKASKAKGAKGQSINYKKGRYN